MFVDNSVVKKFEDEEKYDKFSIASTLFDVSFKGASCSLLEAMVLNNCSSCNLRYMCRKVDEIVEDYTKKTTVVTKNFSFDS
jgi:hypothetical protein